MELRGLRLLLEAGKAYVVGSRSKQIINSVAIRA